ncbi:MAG: plasmid mobilization relaxosome protein MobC [Pseudomonadota bacterium]
METAILKVRLPTELKQAFSKAASRRKMSESALIRAILIRLVTSDTKEVADQHFSLGREYELRDQQMKLTLTRSEKTAIEERAAKEGMKSSYWVVWLVRTYLSNKPHYNPVEVLALLEASRQLAAVGGNLNQITRALNTDFRNQDKLTEELLQEIGNGVKALRLTIKEHAERSINRWGI